MLLETKELIFVLFGFGEQLINGFLILAEFFFQRIDGDDSLQIPYFGFPVPFFCLISLEFLLFSFQTGYLLFIICFPARALFEADIIFFNFNFLLPKLRQNRLYIGDGFSEALEFIFFILKGRLLSQQLSAALFQMDEELMFLLKRFQLVEGVFMSDENCVLC